MNFGEALQALKEDKKVYRTGWNVGGMWLRLVKNGDATQKGKGYGGLVDFKNDGAWAVDNYIGMKTAKDMFVPWCPSQTCMLAEDWIIVE